MAKTTTKKVVDPLEEMPSLKIASEEDQPMGQAELAESEIEWVTLEVPIVRSLGPVEAVPAQINVGRLTRDQRLALRAMFDGMIANRCRVQMRSVEGKPGRFVDRFHHPFMRLLDDIGRAISTDASAR